MQQNNHKATAVVIDEWGDWNEHRRQQLCESFDKIRKRIAGNGRLFVSPPTLYGDSWLWQYIMGKGENP